jgi:hypothetical protein
LGFEGLASSSLNTVALGISFFKTN